MSEESNLAVIEAMWLAWNEQRLPDVASAITPDAYFRHFSLGIEFMDEKGFLT
jgi:hypothetical protein